MMNITTGIPITLVAVVCAEDDEEGDAGDEDSDSVRMAQDFVFFVCGDVGFDEEEEEGGDEAWDGCSPDGRTVDAEDEVDSDE
jgi:hypothetical protein